MVPGQICQYLIEWYGDEWSCFSDYEKPESQEMAEVEGLSDQEFRKDYMPGIRKGKLLRSWYRTKSTRFVQCQKGTSAEGEQCSDSGK